jgi:hypothetical protein
MYLDAKRTALSAEAMPLLGRVFLSKMWEFWLESSSRRRQKYWR